MLYELKKAALRQTKMENTSDRRPRLSSASEDGSTGDYYQEDSAQDGQEDDSRKRKRLSVPTSCELCRARKVKCDRAEPSCGWCARNSRVCIYREKQRPGFRAGYGRELEQKINRLEAMLQLLGRRLELHIVEHKYERDSRPPPQFQPTANQQGLTLDSELRRSVPTDISSQELSTNSESRRLNGAGYEKMQCSRPSNPISVQSLMNVNVTESTDQHASSGTIGLATGGAREAISEIDLPPQDTLYTIVDLYFKHVNPWCPILDRKATLDKLFGSSVATEADHVLLHAIVRITLRFYKDPSLTPKWREQYHTISKQKILLHAFEHTSIDELQALMILALDVLGKSYGPQSWTLLSMIVSNVMQFGLGTEMRVALGPPNYHSAGTLQEFALPQPTSWIENEGRRRLFWMTYILDRYACVDAGSDFTLDEQQTDRPLPCRYDLFSKNQPVETRRFVGPERPEITVNRPENLGSFSYHCEVLRILSRIHKFLRRPIDIGSPADVEEWQATYRKLDRELDRWLYNLPDDYSRISQLCHSSPTSRISNWIMLHAAFIISVLRLHSCAAYPTVRSHIFSPSFNAMQRCIAAVESLREIVQDVVNTGMLDLLGPHFAFALWVSARVLLVDASAMNTDINANIWFFVSTLEKMGQFWGVARKYAQILERILQEYQEAKRAAVLTPSTPASSHSPPSLGPKSLTDMRRNAYDLSILLAQRSTSALHPPSVKVPAPNELEYYEVFDFFNYPRPSVAVGHQPPLLTTTSTPSETLANNGVDNWTRPKSHFVSTNFTYSRSDPDWLAFQPPQD
ncbi:hypothetical protein AJ78_02976 [Emergomyces pasteurianus Ep9510]|uniref:Zn(2)-C6 fungal-type domain-containing protein n=1 Tax=Emergomyces pasteurianus Ep9510 TaxID=1447872 RepID=A0A1J9QL16_9EURO|nr:hypothetical protein AJ78_02976 [Emergomyces pasteurianus Ep9510]